MAQPYPWTANTCTCTGTCPCCCRRVVVVTYTTDSWEMAGTRLSEALQLARQVLDQFDDQYAEKEEIPEPREPVPRGPRPELRSEPAPRRECESYRVSRARPPPRTRPSSEGREDVTVPTETALDVLAAFHSWQLNRVSPNTYPADVVVTLRRGDQTLTEAEVKAVADLIRTGTCYRCRIGKGRYFFGDSPIAAAKRAAANARKEDRK